MTEMNLSRLRWACRRGMLELDLILEPYVEKQYLKASAEEQAAFVALLECTDQDLFDWLVKRQAAQSPMLQNMVNRLLAHASL